MSVLLLTLRDLFLNVSVVEGSPFPWNGRQLRKSTVSRY